MSRTPVDPRITKTALASNLAQGSLTVLSFSPNTIFHDRQDCRQSNPAKMKSTFASVSIALAAVVLSGAPGVHAAYNLVRAWEGQTFFDGWEFYGNYDNLTNVSVSRFDRCSALDQGTGRRGLGQQLFGHHRPPGIRRQQRKGHSQGR